MDCEPIVNEDGHKKNDCELNASKRLLTSLLEKYGKERSILEEDSLYAINPHINQILAQGWSFVLGVKPKRHRAIFSLLEGRKERNQLKTITIKANGKTQTYSFMNNVPLNNQKDRVRVNVLHYQEEDKNREQKIFTWVGDIKINKANAALLTLIGGSRWKIENETFNTLKNQGYHFEHNFGHGNKNLSIVLAMLMFLAFTVDEIQQHSCTLFKALWNHIKQKTKLCESMRACCTILPSQSMEMLVLNMAQIWNIRYPDP